MFTDICTVTIVAVILSATPYTANAYDGFARKSNETALNQDAARSNAAESSKTRIQPLVTKTATHTVASTKPAADRSKNSNRLSTDGGWVRK